MGYLGQVEEEISSDTFALGSNLGVVFREFKAIGGS